MDDTNISALTEQIVKSVWDYINIMTGDFAKDVVSSGNVIFVVVNNDNILGIDFIFDTIDDELEETLVEKTKNGRFAIFYYITSKDSLSDEPTFSTFTTNNPESIRKIVKEINEHLVAIKKNIQNRTDSEHKD